VAAALLQTVLGCMLNLVTRQPLPPAEGVAMLESAGIDHAAGFLQQLDDVLVSILQSQDTDIQKSERPVSQNDISLLH